jgi:TnpA family transposase
MISTERTSLAVLRNLNALFSVKKSVYRLKELTREEYRRTKNTALNKKGETEAKGGIRVLRC